MQSIGRISLESLVIISWSKSIRHLFAVLPADGAVGTISKNFRHLVP